MDGRIQEGRWRWAGLLLQQVLCHLSPAMPPVGGHEPPLGTLCPVPANKSCSLHWSGQCRERSPQEGEDTAASGPDLGSPWPESVP